MAMKEELLASKTPVPRIMGTETTGHMTESQVVARVREVFTPPL